jgi:CotH kinase protein
VTGVLRRWTPLVAAIAALVAVGLVVEVTDAFPLLRAAVQRTPASSPSTLVLPPDELARGLPTVSLYVREADLHDPAYGILEHPIEHGRAWEREGWVSFFDEGRLVYSTGAGVRVHGGGSRHSPFAQAFRIYFRRRYGTRSIPGSVAFGQHYTLPLNRLIVHNDMRVWPWDNSRWHLVNPLAYDIARAIGNITPATRPVRFYLNGTVQGVFVLTEHFDAVDYFVAHRGHRVLMEDEDLDALWRTVTTTTPLTLRTIAPLVDVDNLTRWFIAVLFCGTSDAYQGPGQFLDPTRTTAPWFWVTWDLDQSFRVPEHDTFAALLEVDDGRRGRRANEPRPRILTTLIRDDPEYREYFKAIWVDVMNHVLTPAFLDERYEFYAEKALVLWVRDMDYLPRLRRYFAKRPAILRAQAEHYLGTGPSVVVRLARSGRPVTLDGHRVLPGWQGYYFPGMTVHLAVAPERAAMFSHWLVNGVERAGLSIAFPVNENTVVESVWR